MTPNNPFTPFVQRQQDTNIHDVSRRMLNQVNALDSSMQVNLQKFLPQPFKPYGTKRTYPQDWPVYNAVKQREGALVKSILDELLKNVPVRIRKRGKGRKPIALRDKVFYTVLQAYQLKSSRPAVDVIHAEKAKGFVKRVPHFNTITNSLRSPLLTAYLTHLINVSGLPLRGVEDDFAIDASGFSLRQYGQWFNIRLGGYGDRREFVKLHLCAGTKTNIITAATVTVGSGADNPQVQALVDQTNKVFSIKTLSADKAYSSRKTLSSIAALGATPYIPFKKNSSGRPKGDWIWRRMLEMYRNNPEEFKRKYHLRSNSETNFHMIKSKFGTHLRSKTLVSQTNEVLARCLAHNLCVLAQEAAELRLNLDFEKCSRIPFAQ